MSAIQFVLNGKPWCETAAPPTMTVLDWLRMRARLTGTKEGCAEGDCGACSIAVASSADGKLDYRVVNSCLMMLPQIDQCAVLTVEGLATLDGPLHPVQQAMIDTDATQCGFCTPGFVMAMFAFHRGGEPADDELIHEALAGNLCRCTGYRSIVEACRRAARTADDRFALAEATIVEQLARSAPCTEYRQATQAYLAPHSLDELLDAMAQSPQAILLAGGTDLGLRVSKEREPLALVISTQHVKELRRITPSRDALELGGAVTYADALPHLDRHFPSFGAMLRRIGSRQIRNLATIAGNLATASPIGDTLPCLMALDATVTLVSRAGQRALPVERFVIDYRKTALEPGELIAAIGIPLLPPGQDFAAYKISKRFDQDISTVIAAFRLERQDGKVQSLRAAYGGMAARVMRSARVEAALTGRPWTSAWLADVDSLIARDFTPLSDHRGGAAYRLRAAAGLLRRFQHETTSKVTARLEAL
jgi:xanthine dehydrogenase small subunit